MTDELPTLEEMARRLARLEAELGDLRRHRAEASAAKARLDRRRLLENPPLIFLIVVLAYFAAAWFHRQVLGG